MTNAEKRELRIMCKQGWSFKDIRDCVDCCDATIKNYMKVFSKENNAEIKAPILRKSKHKKWTEEQKAKYRGEGNPFFGKKHSQETKDKWSISRRTGKKLRTKKGKYIMLHKPEHSKADYKGYIYEHRYIIECQIGRQLKKEEIVHHINNNTSNNKITNLWLFNNQSKHATNHFNELKNHTYLENYKKYMIESNSIEGENRLNPNDILAIHCAILGIENLSNILTLHAIIGEYLNKEWVGKFRNCQVIVGNYLPPKPHKVKKLMEFYIKNYSNYNSWEAHNEFEKIHPFQDLNGRIGRLIWLSKAIKEGYNFKIPFLQMYYYQTLDRQNSIGWD